MPRPAVSLDIHIPGSGSAKAGTNAERHTCKLRILAGSFLRAPHKRASGEVRFLLTKTYMEVAISPTGMIVMFRHGKRGVKAVRRPT